MECVHTMRTRKKMNTNIGAILKTLSWTWFGECVWHLHHLDLYRNIPTATYGDSGRKDTQQVIVLDSCTLCLFHSDHHDVTPRRFIARHSYPGRIRALPHTNRQQQTARCNNRTVYCVAIRPDSSFEFKMEDPKTFICSKGFTSTKVFESTKICLIVIRNCRKKSSKK